MISLHSKQNSEADVESPNSGKEISGNRSIEWLETPKNDDRTGIPMNTQSVNSDEPEMEWITISYRRRSSNKINSKKGKKSARKSLPGKSTSSTSLQNVPNDKSEPPKRKPLSPIVTKIGDLRDENCTPELARLFSFLCDLLEHTLDVVWDSGDLQYAQDVLSLLQNFYERFQLATVRMKDTSHSPSASSEAETTAVNTDEHELQLNTAFTVTSDTVNKKGMIKSYSQATKAHRPGMDTDENVAVALQRKHDQANRNREQYLTDKALRLRDRTNKVETVRYRNQKQQDQLKHYFQTTLQEKQEKAIRNRQDRLEQLQQRAKEEQTRRKQALELATEASKTPERADPKPAKFADRLKKIPDTVAMKEAATERRLAQERLRKERLLNELRKHDEMTLKKSKERQDALAAKQALIEEKNRKFENWKLEKEQEEAEMRREIHEKIKRAAERYGEHIEAVKGKAAAANEQVNKVISQQATKSVSTAPQMPKVAATVESVPATVIVTSLSDTAGTTESAAAGDQKPVEVFSSNLELSKSAKKHRSKLCGLGQAIGQELFSSPKAVKLRENGDLTKTKSSQKKLKALSDSLGAHLQTLAHCISEKTVALGKEPTDIQIADSLSAFNRELAKSFCAFEHCTLPLKWLSGLCQIVGSIDSLQQTPVLGQPLLIQTVDNLKTCVLNFSGELGRSFLFVPAKDSISATADQIPVLQLTNTLCLLLQYCTPGADLTLVAAACVFDVISAVLSKNSDSSDPKDAPTFAWMNYMMSVHIFGHLRTLFLIAHGPLEAGSPLCLFLKSAMSFLLTFTERAINDAHAGFEPSVRDQFLQILSAGEFVGCITMLDAIILYKGGAPRNAASDVSVAAEAIDLCMHTLQFLNYVGAAETGMLQKVLNIDVLQTEFFHFVSFWLRYYHAHEPEENSMVEQLTNELIVLIGLYCASNPKGQALLRWGPAPVILQHLVSMPFKYFHKLEFQNLLLPTLVAAVYKHKPNMAIVDEELALSLLAQYLKDAASGDQQSIPERYRLSLRVPMSDVNKVIEFFKK